MRSLRWLMGMSGWLALNALACGAPRHVDDVGSVKNAGQTGAHARAEAAGATAEGAPREALAWATFSPETFARAKAEHKYIVMDGSAEWCHWCHVMEATTYHDPDVRRLLDSRFIAVKVDVDSRPDLEERYADYGWPATVVFAPDATEIGKYRGYIAPDKFTEILREVVASGVAERGSASAPTNAAAGASTGASANTATAKAPTTPLGEEHLAWIQRATDIELDDYWDETEGGWGRTQKAPLGWNNAWMLEKAKAGDAEAKTKVLFALDQQSKLLDPVWGGIYQYSAAKDWDHAHFEKLMTFQAPALDNYATAFVLTGDAKHLTRARAMFGYLERFMKSEDGAFFTTQDADVNAHDRSKPFMNGHDYYAFGEKDRLSRGLPRIDKHTYGRENGLAIAAYATMYEATKDAAVLASAEKAARRILATHGTATGGITHDAVSAGRGSAADTNTANAMRDAGTAPATGRTNGAAGGDGAPRGKERLYLADNAAFGFGLMRLYEVTKNDDYLKHARAIATFMTNELVDERGGGFFGSTKDPDAAGVFATRRVPFEDNVMALRLLARLARTTNDPKYVAAIRRTLRAISTPEEIKGRGRMLGDYLLALEETKGVRGAPQEPAAK